MAKYSQAFNNQFNLYLALNRSGVIMFCGSKTEVTYSKSGPSAKKVFMLYENGNYKNGKPVETKHPNLVKAVLVAKKGWGLWVDEWSSGIAEGLFTKQEIMDFFGNSGVLLSDAFQKELNDSIRRKKYGSSGMIIKPYTINHNHE